MAEPGQLPPRGVFPRGSACCRRKPRPSTEAPRGHPEKNRRPHGLSAPPPRCSITAETTSRWKHPGTPQRRSPRPAPAPPPDSTPFPEPAQPANHASHARLEYNGMRTPPLSSGAPETIPPGKTTGNPDAARNKSPNATTVPKLESHPIPNKQIRATAAGQSPYSPPQISSPSREFAAIPSVPDC